MTVLKCYTTYGFVQPKPGMYFSSFYKDIPRVSIQLGVALRSKNHK
jgi:hypothetical protein